MYIPYDLYRIPDAIDFPYNAVKYHARLLMIRYQQWYIIDQISNWQNTPHNSPVRSSCGVSLLRCLWKMTGYLTPDVVDWKTAVTWVIGTIALLLYFHKFSSCWNCYYGTSGKCLRKLIALLWASLGSIDIRNRLLTKKALTVCWWV